MTDSFFLGFFVFVQTHYYKRPSHVHGLDEFCQKDGVIYVPLTATLYPEAKVLSVANTSTTSTNNVVSSYVDDSSNQSDLRTENGQTNDGTNDVVFVSATFTDVTKQSGATKRKRDESVETPAQETKRKKPKIPKSTSLSSSSTSTKSVPPATVNATTRDRTSTTTTTTAPSASEKPAPAPALDALAVSAAQRQPSPVAPNVVQGADQDNVQAAPVYSALGVFETHVNRVVLDKMKPITSMVHEALSNARTIANALNPPTAPTNTTDFKAAAQTLTDMQRTLARIDAAVVSIQQADVMQDPRLKDIDKNVQRSRTLFQKLETDCREAGKQIDTLNTSFKQLEKRINAVEKHSDAPPAVDVDMITKLVDDKLASITQRYESKLATETSALRNELKLVKHQCATLEKENNRLCEELHAKPTIAAVDIMNLTNLADRYNNEVKTIKEEHQQTLDKLTKDVECAKKEAETYKKSFEEFRNGFVSLFAQKT